MTVLANTTLSQVNPQAHWLYTSTLERAFLHSLERRLYGENLCRLRWHDRIPEWWQVSSWSVRRIAEANRSLLELACRVAHQWRVCGVDGPVAASPGPGKLSDVFTETLTPV